MLRAPSKCLFNTDRHRASYASLGCLFQHLTTLTANIFHSVQPEPPWHSSVLFLHVLSSVPREQRSLMHPKMQSCSLRLCFLRGCQLQNVPGTASNWAQGNTSAPPPLGQTLPMAQRSSLGLSCTGGRAVPTGCTHRAVPTGRCATGLPADATCAMPGRQQQ